MREPHENPACFCTKCQPERAIALLERRIDQLVSMLGDDRVRLDKLEMHGDQDAREALAGLQRRGDRRTTPAEEALIASALECDADASPYELAYMIGHPMR